MPAQCCKDKWPMIPDDEPVFIIRGKDLLSPATVQRWLDFAVEAGVNTDKMARVEEHLAAILDFQASYPERCKIPD